MHDLEITTRIINQLPIRIYEYEETQKFNYKQIENLKEKIIVELSGVRDYNNTLPGANDDFLRIVANNNKL